MEDNIHSILFPFKEKYNFILKRFSNLELYCFKNELNIIKNELNNVNNDSEYERLIKLEFIDKINDLLLFINHLIEIINKK
jgi:hypothetical protein